MLLLHVKILLVEFDLVCTCTQETGGMLPAGLTSVQW